MEGQFVVAALGIIGVFGSSSLLIYLFFMTRHKQRIALLEHGKEATVFNILRNKSQNLKIGMVAVGIGIGILVGLLLEEIGLPEEPAYFSMILILGGIALIAFYIMDKKNPVDSDKF